MQKEDAEKVRAERIEKIHIDLENFVPYLLSTLSRQFACILESSLKKMDLTISYWRVLACLSVRDGRTLNEIVEFTLLPQSTLSRTLARMERKELIYREKRKGDGRIYNIRITEFGADTLAKAYKAVNESCNRKLAVLSDDEAKIWIRIMKKMVSSLE